MCLFVVPALVHGCNLWLTWIWRYIQMDIVKAVAVAVVVVVYTCSDMWWYMYI